MRKNRCPEITGRLLADLHPNGTVRIVFIAHTGGGNEAPLTAKNLDTAEIDFARTCGLTPERAAASTFVERMIAKRGGDSLTSRLFTHEMRWRSQRQPLP